MYSLFENPRWLPKFYIIFVIFIVSKCLNIFDNLMYLVDILMLRVCLATLGWMPKCFVVVVMATQILKMAAIGIAYI